MSEWDRVFPLIHRACLCSHANTYHYTCSSTAKYNFRYCNTKYSEGKISGSGLVTDSVSRFSTNHSWGTDTKWSWRRQELPVSQVFLFKSSSFGGSSGVLCLEKLIGEGQFWMEKQEVFCPSLPLALPWCTSNLSPALPLNKGNGVWLCSVWYVTRMDCLISLKLPVRGFWACFSRFILKQ